MPKGRSAAIATAPLNNNEIGSKASGDIETILHATLAFAMLRFATLALFCCSLGSAAGPEEQIRAVLDDQVAAWNRGDIHAFMQGYERSPETTFVGKEVRKGYDSVLARYRRDYPDKARMGKTSFSDIEIRMVGDDVAIVLGRFDLARPAEHGGDASGIFSLVFAKRGGEWKILLDHTS